MNQQTRMAGLTQEHIQHLLRVIANLQWRLAAVEAKLSSQQVTTRDKAHQP